MKQRWMHLLYAVLGLNLFVLCLYMLFGGLYTCSQFWGDLYQIRMVLPSIWPSERHRGRHGHLGIYFQSIWKVLYTRGDRRLPRQVDGFHQSDMEVSALWFCGRHSQRLQHGARDPSDLCAGCLLEGAPPAPTFR